MGLAKGEAAFISGVARARDGRVPFRLAEESADIVCDAGFTSR